MAKRPVVKRPVVRTQLDRYQFTWLNFPANSAAFLDEANRHGKNGWSIVQVKQREDGYAVLMQRRF